MAPSTTGCILSRHLVKLHINQIFPPRYIQPMLFHLRENDQCISFNCSHIIYSLKRNDTSSEYYSDWLLWSSSSLHIRSSWTLLFLAQISRSFSYRSLHSWLRSCIGQNPFGVSSCIAQGRRLSWPLSGRSTLHMYDPLSWIVLHNYWVNDWLNVNVSGEERDSRLDSKRGRINTNALMVPKEQLKGWISTLEFFSCRLLQDCFTGELRSFFLIYSPEINWFWCHK